MAEQRKLVRMLTTAVYGGEVPPDARGKRAKDAQASRGLAVAVVRALAEEQWVKEEWLAEQLNLGAKQVRKALHFLEAEGVLRRWQTTERRDDRAPITGRTGAESGSARTYPYCCIDFPRLLDCIRLRLHWLRHSLSLKASEHDHLSAYRCSSCFSEWTELELVGRIQDRSGRFACPHCEHVCEPLADELSVADAESEAAKERRKAKLAEFRSRVDTQLKPLEDMVQRALSGPVLDFGTLQEWKEARRAARRQGTDGLQEMLDEHMHRGASPAMHASSSHTGGAKGSRTDGHGNVSSRGGNGQQGVKRPADDGPDIDVLQHTRFEVNISDDDDQRPAKAARSSKQSRGTTLPSWFATSYEGQENGKEGNGEDDQAKWTVAEEAEEDNAGEDATQEAYWSVFMEQLQKEMSKQRQDTQGNADTAAVKADGDVAANGKPQNALAAEVLDEENDEEDEWEAV